MVLHRILNVSFALTTATALTYSCVSGAYGSEKQEPKKHSITLDKSVDHSFCLQSTKAILNSTHWAIRDKTEVDNWILQVQDLIVNSSGFKKLQEENLVDYKDSKASYAFCIDSAGMPVGFHVLNRDTFTPLDEKISALVESAGPYPAAPNHLPWLHGGMRVELVLAKEFKLSLAPEWPNKRLASISSTNQ